MVVVLNRSGHFIDRNETLSYLQAASVADDSNDNQDRNEHISEISRFEPFSPAAALAAEFNKCVERENERRALDPPHIMHFQNFNSLTDFPMNATFKSQIFKEKQNLTRKCNVYNYASIRPPSF